MKRKSKIAWWLILLGVLSLLFAFIGYVWYPKQFRVAAEVGGGIFLFATLGNVLAPTANQTAYYDKRTGKRVTSDGKPYYTIDEDIRKHGKLLGFLWWAVKYFVPPPLAGAYIGIVVYGIYAFIKMMILCGWDFFQCTGRFIQHL